MIQNIGGGRVIDHGPQQPKAMLHYLSGVALGEAIGSHRVNLSNLGKTTPETRGKFNVTLRRDVERERRLYGGQPRPVGWAQRERDRNRLRREMGQR